MRIVKGLLVAAVFFGLAFAAPAVPAEKRRRGGAVNASEPALCAEKDNSP